MSITVKPQRWFRVGIEYPPTRGIQYFVVMADDRTHAKERTEEIHKEHNPGVRYIIRGVHEADPAE